LRATASLRQTGDPVTGQVFFIGHLCVALVPVSGTASGSGVVLAGTTLLDQRFELRGRFSADRRTVSGRFAVGGPAVCPENDGTFERALR